MFVIFQTYTMGLIQFGCLCVYSQSLINTIFNCDGILYLSLSGRRRRRSTNPAPPVTIWTLAGLLKRKEDQVHTRYINLSASARYTAPRLEKWQSEIAVVNKGNLLRHKRSVEATATTNSNPVHWHLDPPACTGRFSDTNVP